MMPAANYTGARMGIKDNFAVGQTHSPATQDLRSSSEGYQARRQVRGSRLPWAEVQSAETFARLGA